MTLNALIVSSHGLSSIEGHSTSCFAPAPESVDAAEEEEEEEEPRWPGSSFDFGNYKHVRLHSNSHFVVFSLSLPDCVHSQNPGSILTLVVVTLMTNHVREGERVGFTAGLVELFHSPMDIFPERS